MNVIHRFGIKDQADILELRNILDRMQSAPTFSIFIAAGHEINNKLANCKPDEILAYLLGGIHPRHWTVFGNRTSIPDAEW